MIPCYVIHLDDTFPNRQSLVDIGLDPIGFKGIDGRKNEHLRHLDRLNPVCQLTCPKTVIGCGLSHILLAERLSNEGVPIALVLEDDAYPIEPYIDFEEIVRSAPVDWEMIKLHCDMRCKDGTVDAKGKLSAAAYILNKKGIEKVKNIKLLTHVDGQFTFLEDIKMYKTKYNKFRTDESTSINRAAGKGEHWLSMYIPEPTSGEKINAQLFTYKHFRIPGTDIEFTLGFIINLLVITLLLFLIRPT